MKLQILSDLHTETYKDAGIALIDSLPVLGDVLICAGDLGSHLTMPRALGQLCDRWPHVVYVTGNHEYGKVEKAVLHGLLRRGQDKIKNLTWLNNSTAVIQGVKFLGGTMWYPDDPLNQMYEKGMWDFSHIPNFRKWVYQDHGAFERVLKDWVDKDTVVVTHHLPSWACVSPHFRGSPLNRFFVSNQEGVILDAQPKLWVHGHTHESLDFQIGETRIVCNPCGYSAPRNRNFIPDLVVEV